MTSLRLDLVIKISLQVCSRRICSSVSLFLARARFRRRCFGRGDRHQVKRIVVKPGRRLSLQMHHHRAQHWVVVHGTAIVTVGDEVRTLQENQSIYIPIATRRRLEDPGEIDLELIEVQSGSYLGEDDIVRFEDDYNRT